MALNKLRATLGEVRLSQADDTAKLSALWGRLTLAKQAGRQVDLRATIFGCLASEAEREADKLVRRHELRSSKQPGQYRGDRRTFQVSDVTKTTVEGVRPTRNAMPAETLATSHVIVISDGISQPQTSHAQNNNKGYGFFLL